MTQDANFIHRILAHKKGIKDPNILAAWTPIDLLSFFSTISIRAIRGLIIRSRLGKARGLILCERGVRLYHPRYVSAGHALNLEEGCEIVGLSKRGIVFGDRCTVGRFSTIRPTNILIDEPGEGLKMGNHSNIGSYSYVGCSGYIDIGESVIMGPRVNLLAENHNFGRGDIPIKQQGVKRGFIKIEDNCWIGANVTIVSGVTIGAGSVIAAGSIVTKDVPSNSVVAGIPARIVKSRVTS
jgi:acetyltransferase-like isoleucine patch superfamily enzyme